MESFSHVFDKIIEKNLTGEQLKEFNRIYYGQEEHCFLKLKENTKIQAKEQNFDVVGYYFAAESEELRKPRIVKLGLIQHSIVAPTNHPIDEQRKLIFNKIQGIIETAALEEVNIICLQETWSMPFFLCTGEKKPFSDFAEPATDGRSVTFLKDLARKHKVVIISPILENDGGTWWNTAVVIDDNGEVMGKHRKNHLPSVGSFSEIGYYSPGKTGHPVFETKFGRIAVNICYGRHQALNWQMFALNGAEIVFNPAATISAFGESFWGIEARNAAIANSYFTCSINRVGTEEFEDYGKSRSYYGSSYVTAPNGVRTPSLSREKDGLLIVQVDLNLCRQMKDHWGFPMTSRMDYYVEELARNQQTGKLN